MRFESTRARGVLCRRTRISTGCCANGSQHMHRPAGVITNDVPDPDARQHHAVGSFHPMLEGDVRAGWFQNLSSGACHPLAIIRMYQRKYSLEDVGHVLRALAYFDDADQERMPRMLRNVGWRTVKQTIQGWLREVAA